MRLGVFFTGEIQQKTSKETKKHPEGGVIERGGAGEMGGIYETGKVFLFLSGR